MKVLYKSLAITGLLLTVVPAFLRYGGMMSEASMKAWVLAGTFIWFIGATPWLGKKVKSDEL